MITYEFLNEIKDLFPLILKQKSAQLVDTDDMAINYKGSIIDRLDRQLFLLKENTELLSQARKENDELAMQAALLRIRSHSMSLSSFFDAIAEDATLLIKADGWPDIPENYQVPRHYNFSRE